MKRHLELILISILSIILTIVILPISPKVIDGGSPWSNGFDNHFACDPLDISNMYNDYIDSWKIEISKAFDEAEIKIYSKKPTPNVIGIDPDPTKCICKGTGTITHGDGHTTDCSYHGIKFNNPLIILEE